MFRTVCLLSLCLMILLCVGLIAFFRTSSSGNTWELETKINKLVESPYVGPLEGYQNYAEQLGEDILVLAAPYFRQSNLSQEQKDYLYDMKKLGLLLRYAFDSAVFEKKYEEFLDSAQIASLYRGWIYEQFIEEISKFEDKKIERAERAKRLSSFLEYWAPRINTYFVDENVDANMRIVPFYILQEASEIDPDGSLGLVRLVVDKLRPAFETKIQTDDVSTRFLNRMSLNSIQRLDMVGKPLVGYTPVDLDGKPVDMNGLKGKVVLIVSTLDRKEEEKLPCIRNMYNSLKDQGFEIIITPNDIEAARIQNDPWIVVNRKSENGQTNYVEYFGCRLFALLVDRRGIVLTVRSDGNSPAIYEKLKSLFPEQQDLIVKAAEEISAIDGEAKEERRLGTVEDADIGLPKVLRKLIKLQQKIHDIAPPEINLGLVDLVLSSCDIPEKTQEIFLVHKVRFLGDLAEKTASNRPEIRPEQVFQEMEELVDELFKTSPPIYHRELFDAKYRIAYQMLKYLNAGECGQEEYAAKITQRFVDVTKTIPETYFRDSYEVLMHLQRGLEEYDGEHSTQLANSFLEQVIPVFTVKGGEYQRVAGQLNAVLKRSSLIGKELDFECILLNGKQTNVKDFRGKVVTINFWATWCGPCIGEFPNMKAQYIKYKDQGYEMIAYSIDDDFDAVMKFQETKQYPWLVGSQLKSKDALLADYYVIYGIQVVPTTFILDRNGRVRYIMTGSNDDTFNRELEKCFVEVSR